MTKFFPFFRRVSDLKDVLWSGSLTFEHALSTSAANVDGKAFVYMLIHTQAATCLSSDCINICMCRECICQEVCKLHCVQGKGCTFYKSYSSCLHQTGSTFTFIYFCSTSKILAHNALLAVYIICLFISLEDLE